MKRKQLVFSGSGGQGVITAAILLGEAAVIHEGINAGQSQSYGAAARGGATRSDVILSEDKIDFPGVIEPNIVVCLTQEAYSTYAPEIRPGGMLLAAWLLLGTLAEWAERVRLFKAPLSESLRRAARLPRAAWGMTLTHGGLALFIAGATASSAWKVEAVQSQHIGEAITVSGYTFTLREVKDVVGPNYTDTVGVFEVTKGGKFFAEMTPSKRVYKMPPRPTTEAAIVGTFLGDVYAVVGDKDAGGGYVTRLYFNPLVPWMWVGALVMVVGGLTSLSDRRHRVGAPTPARAPAHAVKA